MIKPLYQFVYTCCFKKVVYTSSICNHLLNNRIIFKERIYIDDVHDTHVLMKIKPGSIIQ